MKELRFPKRLIPDIEKLAKKKAAQILKSDDKSFPMAEKKQVDPYKEEDSARRRAEVQAYLIDMCSSEEKEDEESY